MVAYLIEGGHIDPRNLARTAEKSFPCVGFIPFHFDIEIKERIIADLPLSQIDQVKEICHRLRIIGAGAATDNQGIAVCPILLENRNLPQIQNL